METAVRAAFPLKEGKPNFIRYADDFVVLHPTEEGVRKARAILETWLKDMGLELKPSKTRITHTLRNYQGTTGFDFLAQHSAIPRGKNPLRKTRRSREKCVTWI